MGSKDRIPQGIRKQINKIGPGKYCDPATGRIYVDSADMDDAFEQMQDDVRNADAKRDAERAADAARPKPPDHVREQADAHLLGLAQRFEDSAWVGRAKSRREHLLGRQRWKRSIGAELEPEDLEELADLDSALHTEEAMGEVESVPEGMQELVDSLWGTITNTKAIDSDKLEACAELGGLILEEAALPIPTGYDYDAAMLKTQVFATGEAISKRVGASIFEPLLRKTEEAASATSEEPEPVDPGSGDAAPERKLVPGIPTMLKDGPPPFKKLMLPIPEDMESFHVTHDPVAGEVSISEPMPEVDTGIPVHLFKVDLESRNEVGQVAKYVKTTTEGIPGDTNPEIEPPDNEPPADDTDGFTEQAAEGEAEDEDEAADEQADRASDDGRSLEI